MLIDQRPETDRTRNPATGMLQRKVTFVKRVVAYGLLILVGSGYYLEEGL